MFVWDLKTGEPYGSPLTAGTSPVNDVTFSPDGRTLVSSHLRSAVVWNVNGVQAIGRPLGGPTDLTTDVAFSPDGKWLAAGQFDGGATVYNAATRRQAYRIAGGSVTTAVAFDSDGKYLALGTIDGTAQLFDAKSGAVVGRPLDVGRGAIWQMAFSPDARLLAIAVDRNGVDGFYLQRRQGEVQLWDVDTSDRVGRAIAPGAGSVLSVAFNADGTLLATGSYKGRLDLWDVATQKRHGKPMTVVDDGVPSVAFDPSGELVAGGGAIGPARVWRVADQRPAFPPLAGHTGPITGTAFDPHGSFLATTTLFGATQALGPGDRSRLRRRVRRKPESAQLAHVAHRPSVPRAAQRVQPGRQAAGGRGNRDARDAVGRRPRGLAPACVRDRGPQPDARGMEAVPAGGDVLSRDVFGVARRLTLPNGQKLFP